MNMAELPNQHQKFNASLAAGVPSPGPEGPPGPPGPQGPAGATGRERLDGAAGTGRLVRRTGAAWAGGSSHSVGARWGEDRRERKRRRGRHDQRSRQRRQPDAVDGSISTGRAYHEQRWCCRYHRRGEPVQPTAPSVVIGGPAVKDGWIPSTYGGNSSFLTNGAIGTLCKRRVPISSPRASTTTGIS